MKIRRFFTYILMITLLMGNTMRVSATPLSVSGNEAEEGILEENDEADEETEEEESCGTLEEGTGETEGSTEETVEETEETVEETEGAEESAEEITEEIEESIEETEGETEENSEEIAQTEEDSLEVIISDAEKAEAQEKENICVGGWNASGEIIEEKWFAKWSDAIAYLNAAGDKSECVIEIVDTIDIDEKLTFPSKAKSVVIRGVQTEEPGIVLAYIGDISLLSDTSFENIKLSAKKLNASTKEYDSYKSVLNINGKKCSFKEVTVSLASVAGNSKSEISMKTSKMMVDKAVTSLGNLNMNSSQLFANNVTITGNLLMNSAQIDCVTKLTLNTVVTESPDNVLAYGGNTDKNILTIKGNISSSDASDTVVTIVRKDKEEDINRPIIIRKNAITLMPKSMETEGYASGLLLCNATKAGASWFVVGRNMVDLETDILWNTVTYGTHKVGSGIVCGELEENVNLYSSKTEEGEYLFEGGFVTLQDAFSEIDKLSVKENYYRIELMKADKEVVTFSNRSLKFPSKTAGVTVGADKSVQGILVEPKIYFKGNLQLKSDIVFEEIVFVPTVNALILLGDNSLKLSNCYVESDNPTNPTMGFYGVEGSGVKKNSELILEDTSLFISGNVTNVGKIAFAGDENAGREPQLRAYGSVSVGDIELGKDAYLAGEATVTRKKSGKIKKVTAIVPKITVSQSILSENDSTLYLDLYEKNGKNFQQLNLDTVDMADMEKKGIKLAKALLVTYPNIRALQREETNRLIKSAGYLMYYPESHGVELEFTKEEGFCKIPCLTFMDAVTEINNQKTKRDYVITLKKAVNETSGALQNNTSFVPKTIKMPMAKYINSLVLQGDVMTDDIRLGYMGNIAFTCDTVVRDVAFVQMVRLGNKYKTADEAKKEFPKIVTVSTGGYALDVEGTVTFNTPIILNGKEKGILSLDTEGTIATLTNQYNGPIIAGENIIYGMLTGFKEININQCNLTLKEYKSSVASTTYKASTNKASNVTLIGGNITVEGQKTKGAITVLKELSIDSGNLWVEGKVNVKNVVLEGGPSPTIKADHDFLINGTLTSRSDNSTLLTRLKGQKKAPYLMIKGNVICEESAPVYVGVYPDNSSKKKDDTPVRLKNAPKVTGQLLTASKAPAKVFRPIAQNTGGYGEYDSETNPNGYWVGKVKSNVYVYEGKKE